MKNVNGKLCRYCLNDILGTKLKPRDCSHTLGICEKCGGDHSYYTVTGVTTLIGKLKLRAVSA